MAEEEESKQETTNEGKQTDKLSARQEYRMKEHQKLKERKHSRTTSTPSSSSSTSNNNNSAVAVAAEGGGGGGDEGAVGPSSKKDENVETGGEGGTEADRSRGFTLPQGGKIDFMNDKPGHQLVARRLAAYLSTRYAWYNPQLRKERQQQQEEQQQQSGSSPNEGEQEGPATGVAAAEGGIGGEGGETGGTGGSKKESNEGIDRKKPSIAEAWAFFEHVTLNRWEIPDDYVSQEGLPWYMKFFKYFCLGERKLEMAEPGENNIPTKLYHPINTPLSQMGDFGHGYGLYFSSLRSFAILAFCAGIINIPNLMYYGSNEYDPTKANQNLTVFTHASAICTWREWVPCPDCQDNTYLEAPGYPVLDRLVHGYKDIDTTGGTMLNSMDYFQAKTCYDYSGCWELVYNESSLQKLKDDYNITYIPEYIGDKNKDYKPARLEFGPYNRTYQKGYYDCYYDCLFEILRCQNDAPCDLYMDLSLVQEEMPPYGNAEKYTFAEKTLCDGATKRNAAVNLATMIFFMCGAIAIRMLQKQVAVKFDEDEQTAQDYSVNIINPPEDARDPKEWKDFFESNFDDCHVTVCTIDVDNDDVLKLFIERRNVLKNIEVSIPEGTSLDIPTLEEEAKKAEAELSKAGCCTKMLSPDIPKMVSRLKELNEQIKKELTVEKEYPVTNIFLTFETEKAQRDVLSTLTVGTAAAQNNDTTAVPDPKYLFRGRHVLEIDEPEEPTAIIWDDLNATKFEIVSRLVITSIITAILAIVAIIIIVFLYAGSPGFATLITTVFTCGFPMIAKMMTGMEYHRSESSRQKWMFIKISLFHIVLTTILFAVVTPFLATLDARENSSPGLIPAVHALFYSQLLLTPVLQLSDYMGHLNRHFFGPRAKTQESMNMNFTGSAIYLADRYANLIKYIYLMVWYCAVYPGAFFMGSLALWIVYFTDRFSLMRSWARTPQVGPQIAEFARNYFQPLAILMMAIISAYYWSGFPYDNLCDSDEELDPGYVGNWTIEYLTANQEFLGITLYEPPNVDVKINIEPGDPVYKYCNQNLLNYDGRSFPALPKWQIPGFEWMTEEQANVLVVYGWISVAILAGICTIFLLRLINTILKAFRSTYDPHGRDMERDFSSDKHSIDSYIPEKRTNFFAYPLILCDVSDFDEHLFSWKDPDKPYQYYSLYEDVKGIFPDESELKIEHIFSDVAHWPPEKKKSD